MPTDKLDKLNEIIFAAIKKFHDDHKNIPGIEECAVYVTGNFGTRSIKHIYVGADDNLILSICNAMLRDKVFAKLIMDSVEEYKEARKQIN